MVTPPPTAQSNPVARRPRAWSATVGEGHCAPPAAVRRNARASLELAGHLAGLAWMASDESRDAGRPGDDPVRLRDLFERSPVGLLAMDPTGAVLRANAAALALLHREDASNLVGTALGDCCTPESRTRLSEHLRVLAASSRLDSCELDLVGESGDPYPIRLTTLAVGDGGEGPLRCALLDLSGLREMEAGLALAASVVEHTAEGVVVTDANRRIVAVNPAFTAITGYPAAEAIGRVSAAFWPNAEGGEAPERLADALREQGYWRGKIRCRRKSGESYPAWVSVSEIRDGGTPTHYVCMLSDITSQEDAKRELLRLAYCDSLTALPNRASALERIGRALIASRRDKQLLGVLYLDVDRFKDVNDTLGHAVGDRLLRFVAQALRESVRQTDTVARLGGDEFAVLVPDLKRASAAGQIASAILRRFAQTPFRADGREIYVGVSIGIALSPKDAVDCDGLLACADAAMYAAKVAGRGAFRFYAATTGAGYREGHALEAELRHALGRDELRLLYQPRMCLRTSRIVGCEVSLGWQRAGYGMVEPERFLPLAQKTELIVPCEHWALRTLAAEIAQWPGPLVGGLRFALGVSAVHLRALHAERLLRGLEEIGETLGHRPELDFRELDPTDCPDRTLGILERIADMGYPLALDRFGAGPVSLRSLKRLPLRRLKLDPSLICDVERDREAATVVAAIVDLAHAYGLSVLADGVETAGQIGFLQAHGCDEAQGIFKSPPVDADTFCALADLAVPAVTGRRVPRTRPGRLRTGPSGSELSDPDCR